MTKRQIRELERLMRLWATRRATTRQILRAIELRRAREFEQGRDIMGQQVRP